MVSHTQLGHSAERKRADVVGYVNETSDRFDIKSRWIKRLPLVPERSCDVRVRYAEKTTVRPECWQAGATRTRLEATNRSHIRRLNCYDALVEGST